VNLIEPTRRQVLDFCALDPVERVFLEDVARRGLGRFAAVEGLGGEVTALCHTGANIVPSGRGCGAFERTAAGSSARMVIGEANAVTELWDAVAHRFPQPREDRPHQPVYVLDEPPEPGESRLRPARRSDVERLVPACAAAHQLELGIDPLARDPEPFVWRTATQVDEGRSWVWLEDDVVLFKAEASAWTPHAVQISQVWTDPEARGRGYASRGLRDLCRLLLARTPTVTLFVRSENTPAIALYERIGMRKVLEYRTVLF
jgi:predicted GNAT family acetyltransferase